MKCYNRPTLQKLLQVSGLGDAPSLSCQQCGHSGKMTAHARIFAHVLARAFGLCLNPTVQKDSRGVLGTSFRLEKYSEILGNSNMADFIPSVITYLREQAVNNKRSMFLFIFPRLEYRIKSTALNYFQCFKPRVSS